MNDKKVVPIFVVGSPRSGTTLIGNVIGNTNSVCNMEEFSGFFFSYYIAPREFYGVPSPYKKKYIRELQEFSSVFATSITLKKNKQFFCDSTPWNMLIINDLLYKYPNAIIILVIRHFSGVIQSLEKSYHIGYKWAGANWIERANLWSKFYSNAKFIPQKNRVILSYDELCSNPVVTLERFKNDLIQKGLDQLELNYNYLAVNNASGKKITIGNRTEDGSIYLQSIPSYNAESWTGDIYDQILPIVLDTHIKLRDLCSNNYILPHGYQNEY
ncbi:sulfotransferase family protein [Paenibacillus woosongensis]|uniref:sulfotransferase family protein n=1 Tax=Paenibacillus woosongensis TaxID=307580 RepID=UPI0012D87CB1|nr:sulfotransferase [Paenibacillus woosongensis]